MKTYIPIRKRFDKLNISIRDWLRTAGFPMSRQTAQDVLSAYPPRPVDPISLAYLTLCLGYTNREVLAILEQYLLERPKELAKIKLLRRLIAPVELTAEEQTVLERLRKLPKGKRAAFVGMLSTLES